jgi:hypothetical protein
MAWMTILFAVGALVIVGAQSELSRERKRLNEWFAKDCLNLIPVSTERCCFSRQKGNEPG